MPAELVTENTALEAIRICTRCKVRKGVSLFGAVKGELVPWCRDCTRAYNRAWYVRRRDIIRQHAAEWRDRNPDYQERWRERRPDLVAAAQARAIARKRETTEKVRYLFGKSPKEPKTTAEGRLCSRCRERKDPTLFSSDRVRRDGLSTYCRSCAAKSQGEWAARNRDKRREYAFRSGLKRKYGLTEETLQVLIQSQGGKCAVCRDVLRREKRGTHIDHDHVTGAIRGVLCVKCNAGLGQFRDSPEILRAAAQYIVDRRIP